MKDCFSPLVLVLVAVVLLIAFGRQGKPTRTEVVNDTIWDTVTYDMPVVRDSTVIRYVRVKLPVASDTSKTEGIMPRPSLSVDSDSVDVVVPVEQRRYADSTYEAWVSGYMPRLDSIRIYNRTVTVSTVSHPARKEGRLSFGIVAGYGCGMRCGRIEPFVGVGLSYRLFPP